MLITCADYSSFEERVLAAYPYQSRKNEFEIAALDICQREGVSLMMGFEDICLPDQKTIIVKKVKDRESFLGFLHEMGHYHLRDKEFKHVLFEEIEAWRYAFRAGKASKQEKRVCKQFFDGYMDYHGVEPYFVDEIKFLIKTVFLS